MIVTTIRDAAINIVLADVDPSHALVLTLPANVIVTVRVPMIVTTAVTVIGITGVIATTGTATVKGVAMVRPSLLVGRIATIATTVNAAIVIDTTKSIGAVATSSQRSLPSTLVVDLQAPHSEPIRCNSRAAR